MPKASARMMGCQLWVNMPAKDKMSDPAYGDITKEMVAVVEEESAEVRIISGSYKGVEGHFEGKYVKVKYLDEDFVEHEETIDGFAARVVQHECEHLEGKVFIDNISAIRRQLNKGKINSILKGTVKCSYRAKAVGK